MDILCVTIGLHLQIRIFIILLLLLKITYGLTPRGLQMIGRPRRNPEVTSSVGLAAGARIHFCLLVAHDRGVREGGHDAHALEVAFCLRGEVRGADAAGLNNVTCRLPLLIRLILVVTIILSRQSGIGFHLILAEEVPGVPRRLVQPIVRRAPGLIEYVHDLPLLRLNIH